MEPDIYQDCRDDDGMIRDPIFNEIIPEHRIIVVQEGNHKWCLDASVLLEAIVLHNNKTNPMTRSPLSDIVLANIFAYRMTQLCDITLVDNSKSLFAIDNILGIKLDSFYLIGDLHITCAEKLGKGITKVSVQVYITDSTGDKKSIPIDTFNLNDSITELIYGTTTELIAVDGNVVGDSYNKLKKFVSDYDRYKFKFSPFPSEYGERRISTNLAPIVIQPTFIGDDFDGDEPFIPTNVSARGLTSRIYQPQIAATWKPIGLSEQEMSYRDGITQDRPVSTYRYIWDISTIPITITGYRGEDMSYRLARDIDRYNTDGYITEELEQYLGPNALSNLRSGLPIQRPYLTLSGQELTRYDQVQDDDELHNSSNINIMYL